MRITDQAARKAELHRRRLDESVPFGPGYVALRCTAHGTFISWVWACTPDVNIACNSKCKGERE